MIYIGVKSLLSKRAGPSDETIVGPSPQKEISSLAAVRLGFLTNAINPKATLFFLALFTQVISPSTPLSMKLLYGAEMSIATFAWFAFVATVLTHKRVSNIFTGVRQQIERVFGVILVALGIKVALGTKQS